MQTTNVMAHDLCDRTFRFACDITRFCTSLHERGAVTRRLSLKLLDAGTSIGANIEEGRAGQSKPDFIAKNFISLKESRETRFWLRLIAETDGQTKGAIAPLLSETNELIAILTTTLKNARASSSRG